MGSGDRRPDRVDWALIGVAAIAGALALLAPFLDRTVALPLSSLGLLVAAVALLILLGRSVALSIRADRLRRGRPLVERTGVLLEAELGDGRHAIWIVEDDPRPAEIVVDGMRRPVEFPRFTLVGPRRAPFSLGLHRAELEQHADLGATLGGHSPKLFNYDLRVDGHRVAATKTAGRPHPAS